MEKDFLQITLRIKDEKMRVFLDRKLKELKLKKGVGRVSYQAVVEGLISYWMEMDE